MIPRRVSFLVSLCAAAFLVACGSDSGGGSAGPCEGDDPAPACGATCNSLTPCEAGFYCSSNGTCTADCTASGDQCSDGEVCSVDGQCGTGGGDDDGGDGSNDDGDDDDGGDDCPAVTVSLTAVIPDVMLVLDQSGSMDEPFPEPGDPPRWEAMRDALFGPNGGANDDGIIFQLQGQLNMGATLYTNGAGGGCPDLTTTTLALNNAQAIEDMLAPPAEPIQDTPTGESIDAVVAAFPDNGNPRVIVLATDGLPDTCAVPNPQNEQEQLAANAIAETSVVEAFAADITTFALSIGPDVSQDHLQRLANAGQGIDLDIVGPGAAELFQADSPGELATAFETIVGDIRSCEIEVDGNVDLDRADEGTVILEGETLAYGEKADWFMIDQNTFELLGDACETFKNTADVELSAEFPCGVVVDVD
jgi:hypothetical protein